MGFHNSDGESLDNSPRGGCNKCCAYGSLIICFVILILLLAGVIYFAFVQGNLPEVRIQRLDVRRLNITNTKKSTLLTASFNIRMNATNKNRQIGLSYSKLDVEVESQDISVGKTQVPAFYQNPKTTNVFNVSTQVKRSDVTWYDAKDLNSTSASHTMVLDVIFKGKLRFYMNGNKGIAYPFKINCESIDQSEIDSGHAPRCNVKISMV